MAEFWNMLCDKLNLILGAILSFLPDSPFQSAFPVLQDSEFSTWVSWLNWFFPFATFISIAELWLVCIATYYIVQTLLRWAKIIE